jgi:beta-lactamase regulating signal transducer with metallopeptidase domain
MTAGLLLYVALVIALAALAGWALETLCRQFGRPVRWSWLASSAVGLALVARAMVADSVAPLRVAYEGVALPTATATAAAWSPLQAIREAVAVVGAAIGSATEVALRAIPPHVAPIVFVLWLATSLLALATLALVHLRLRRARREWAEAELFGTRVRIAPDAGPAVVGITKPQIVVPRWLLGRSIDEQQLVLAHEREHLGARDHLLLGAGSLVVALVPWHPAAWWMLARLRLAIELDCDARVLRRGVPARTYGTLLIDLADRCTGFRVGATALADEGSHLERRLLAMKTNGTKRSLLRAGVLGAAAALAVLAACEAKVPTGPEIEAMDVAGASQAVARTRMMEKTRLDSAIFYVDGQQVDAKTANSLTPNQIATIDISKGSIYPIIRIATNGRAPDRSARGNDALMRTRQLADTLQGIAVAPQSRKDFTGLLLIDGVKADASALATIDRNRIESIDVIKGAMAEAMSSDPLAKNGIIKITTRK